jgi:hypothetical protein
LDSHNESIAQAGDALEEGAEKKLYQKEEITGYWKISYTEEINNFHSSPNVTSY